MNSDLILYTTEDGVTKVDVTFEDETVWLTQDQMAELFQKSNHSAGGKKQGIGKIGYWWCV